MNTQPEINFDLFFNSIITSYESRIQKIQTAFQSTENITESSHTLFDNIHSTLNKLKEERDTISAKLCENLAKNGSLRKKDYKIMMSGINSSLDEREKEAENQFLIYIENQKNTAQALKKSMLEIKDLTDKDNGDKFSAIKKQLSVISKEQETEKETVIETFLTFQKLQNTVMSSLGALVNKGNSIQIKDIKKVKESIINEINQ